MHLLFYILFLSPHLTLSFSASTLTSLSSISSPSVHPHRHNQYKNEKRWHLRWHLGLSDDISALSEPRRSSLLPGPPLRSWTLAPPPLPWVLVDHACATKVWHFFFCLDFLWGLGIVKKEEGLRWWESRSSKKWVRKRGWWWLMIDFLFWIFFFLFDQFWIFCLIHGFWGDGGLMMVAEWVDGGGWVGVDWFEDEYFIWINVCDRKIDMGVLKK